MKTSIVVFCFLLAFVMNSQGQEATEKNEDESAMAPEIMDFKAEEQAADTPNLVNADFGKSFHHLRLLNCMMFLFQVDSYNVFVPVKLPVCDLPFSCYP